MNFIEEYKKGKLEKNIGLPTGLKSLDIALNGIQKKAIYAIAAGPKVGKTTLVDFCFVIEPALYYLQFLKDNPETTLRINWIYYSYEVDRIEKEYKYAAHFIHRDFGVSTFMYENMMYKMSSNYLLGKLKNLNDPNKMVPVSEEHEAMLKEVYAKRIIPLFGEYSADGKLIKAGLIRFVEDRENPTGLRNELMHYAKTNGTFIEEKYHTRAKGADGKEHVVEKSRIRGYKPNNPDLVTIIITDHMRKLNKERGFTLKENIDKWVEYQVELRNWCHFTFVDIIHLNRAIGSIERIRFLKDKIYPTGDDVKDTGNLSEEANYILTLFNPREEKYNLTTHFGVELINYPNYRSLHLVESRDTECPQHLATQMFSNINSFNEI